ncbi:alpha/beta hydrolase family protein [Paenibacillus cremeus]|uniref:Prolyl oligopeptidase family serine peptidase n=1 Tax=Paenibacillus cremeus TaxID=2163881 RepID=A0A559K9X3_9BACL|nr:alpha/beta hydrolase family protein [Paenibacillus cremeus]TVY08893.1 prolyl oligopeptidase family serine peptidase [Paenibacillus cremeus]
MWNPDEYLKYLYNSIEPAERFKGDSAEEWTAWRDRYRAQFIQRLGGFPETAPELNPVLLESVDCGSYTRQRIQIQTFEQLQMPVYVLIPKQADEGRRAVIACHGHGYGSRDIVGLKPDGSPKDGELGYQKNFAVELVERGFVVVAPELFGFGDRKLTENAKDPHSCNRLSSFLLSIGKTMASYRVYETMRCVDYLLTRDDVDGQRIGIMGISGGGLVSSFTAAVDERIAAAVVSGFGNTFEASILAMHHCIDNYVPGLSLDVELPDVISLIAPRPLLLEAGKSDRIFPIHGTLEAYEALSIVYSRLDVSDRLELDLFEGEHEISGRVAYDWFGKML